MISRRNWFSKATATLLVVFVFVPSVVGLHAKDTDSAPPAAVHTSTVPEGDSADTQAHIAKLITQLGDAQYLIRQAAQEELFRIGPEAFDALTTAANHDDIEIASRANYLLRLIRIESDNDSPQVKRILQGYGLMDDDGRFAKVRKLASLVQGEGLVPLCRLVRFEKSNLLSKQCALLVLGQTTANAAERLQRAKIIETVLATSNRPGARRLRAYLRLEGNAEAVFAEWNKFLDDEIIALRAPTPDSSSEIIMALGRYEVDWLLARDRKDQALAVMRRMISVEKGELPTLIQLSEWLLKLDAIPVEQELIARFESTFRSNPLLLYFKAQTQRLAGKNDEAEELAAQATKLISNDDPEDRLRVAANLQQRGLFDWSEREYRRVIETLPKDSEAAIFARVYCADMLHDVLREQQAAEMLKELVDAIAADGNVAQKLQSISSNRTEKTVRARMNFYYACQFQLAKDAAEEWKYLTNALAEDAQDADVLIAMYRASANDAEKRQKVMETINKNLEVLTRRINGNTEDPMHYNEYAWLVGNTEGDFDQAIDYSQKSIELVVAGRRDADFDDDTFTLWPGSIDREPAAYIDTLAHCYAGKGDYENAVKHQAHAAELEPHSMAIVRALDEFKTALEKSRQKN